MILTPKTYALIFHQLLNSKLYVLTFSVTGRPRGTILSGYAHSTLMFRFLRLPECSGSELFNGTP